MQSRRHTNLAWNCPPAAGGYPNRVKPTTADLDLSKRLEERGIRASPGRLRHLRSERRIHGPNENAHNDWRYSDGAVEYSAAYVREVDARHNCDEATLALFGRGHLPPIGGLRKAFVADIDATRKYLFGERDDNGDALGRAEELAAEEIKQFPHSTVGRSVQQRIRRLGRRDRSNGSEPVLDPETREDSYIESLLIELLHVPMTGEPITDGGLQEALDVLGIGAMARDAWTFEGPNGPEKVGPLAPVLVDENLYNLLRGFQLETFQAIIEAASLDDLVAARDDFKRAIQLFDSASTAMRFVTDLPDAFGFGAFKPIFEQAKHELGDDLFIGRYCPLVLLVRSAVPSYSEGFAALMSGEMTIAAQASLRKSLPPGFGLNGLEKLKRQGEKGSDLVRAWIRDQPEMARAAGALTSETAADSLPHQ